MEIFSPRDRETTFKPQIVKKGQRRFEGFDDKIISMYARGMSIIRASSSDLEFFDLFIMKPDS